MRQAQPEWRPPVGHISSVTPKPVAVSKEPDELLRLFGRFELEVPLILQRIISGFEGIRDPENKEPRLGSRINIIQGFFREVLEPSVFKDMISLNSGPRDRTVVLVGTRLNSARDMLANLGIERSANPDLYRFLASLRKANTLASAFRSGRKAEQSSEDWQANVSAALVEMLSVIDANATEPVVVCRQK